MADTFCDNLMDYAPIPMFAGSTGVVSVVLGLIYIVMGFTTVYFIKYNEWKARSGNNKAVGSVIFPVFVYVLWGNAFINFYVGMVAMNYSFRPFASNSVLKAFLFSVMYALQHMVIEGVAFLLMQKGLGFYAARKAFVRAVVWGAVTFLVYFVSFRGNSEVLGFIAQLLWGLALVVFYLLLWITPERRLFRRSAAIDYAKYWFIFRSIAVLSTIFYFAPPTEGVGNCVYIFGTVMTFALFEPLLVYYTLLQDSRWWQGLDIFQGRRNSSVEEIKSPLRGIDLNLSTAQSLAASMDLMSGGFRRNVLRERSANPAVKLLNFAYITLDKNRQLGSGSFSKVFYGSYRSTPCAIKLIFTLDLTLDIIRRIAAEAQILSMFKHPNIVQIYGVSVLPPSVCILLEFCAYGSLADVIAGTGPISTAVGVSENRSLKSMFRRAYIGDKGLYITWADRLYLAIGCARGLNALHAHSPDLCHRDIKSFNFLVDHQLNVKLSDLELGTSSEFGSAASKSNILPKKRRKGQELSCFDRATNFLTYGIFGSQQQKKNDMRRRRRKRATKDLLDAASSPIGLTVVDPFGPADPQDAKLVTSTAGVPKGSIVPPPVMKRTHSRDSSASNSLSFSISFQSDSSGAPAEDLLSADDFLANWSAPEVIQDGVHVQRSDVYALSLVFWEILFGSQPFSSTRRQDDIRFKILSGERPELPAWTVEDNYPNATVDERNIRQFVALITRGWQHEVSARPSTSEILSDLECLYHQYCHENLMETGAVPRNLFEAISESTIRRPSFGTAFGLFSGSSGNTLDDAMIASFQGQRLFARVTEALQSEEAVQDLDRHDGAWLLVTAEAPHIAVWTSRQWRSLTGYSNEAVLGKCLRELMQGNLTERSVQDEFISNFTKDLGKDEFRQNHALLTLYKQQVMSFTKSNSSSKLDKLIGSADSVDSTGVKSVNSGVSMVSGGSLQSSIHSSMQSGNTVTNVISYKAMIFSLYAYRIKHRAVDVVVENKVPLSTLTSIQQNSDKNNKTTVKRSDEVTRGTIDSNTMRRTSGRYTQSEQTSSLIDSEYRSGDNESVQETSTIASEDQQNRKRAGSGSSLNFMFGSGKKKNSITDSSQLDGASIASSSSYSVKSGPNGQKKIEEKEPPDALIAILFSKFKFVDDASDPDMDSSVMINMLSKDSGVSTTSNTITPESRETRKPFVPPEIKIDSKITRNRTSITIKKIEGAESPVDDHILV